MDNHAHSPAWGHTLPCPCCGQWTDRLKRFRLIEVLLFYFLGVAWQTNVYTACPPCTRRLLWRNTLFNLLFANVLWPIILVPWNLALWLDSRAAGHSEEIQEIVNKERERLAAAEAAALGAAFASPNGGGEAIQRLAMK